MKKVVVSKSALKEKYESLDPQELKILARENFISLHRTKLVTRNYSQDLEYAPAGLVEIFDQLENFILRNVNEEESLLSFQVGEDNYLQIKLEINSRRDETPEELKTRLVQELVDREISKTTKNIAREQNARKELETETTLVD